MKDVSIKLYDFSNGEIAWKLQSKVTYQEDKRSYPSFFLTIHLVSDDGDQSVPLRGYNSYNDDPFSFLDRIGDDVTSVLERNSFLQYVDHDLYQEFLRDTKNTFFRLTLKYAFLKMKSYGCINTSDALEVLSELNMEEIMNE